MNRILAIEPDADRGALLAQLVHEHLDSDIVIAASADAAITVMRESPPDLILTSMLLAADEEQDVVLHLRATPSLRHLPVLTIPAITSPSTTDARSAGLFSRLLRRQKPQVWPAYNLNAVITRIAEALEQSRVAAAEAAEACEITAPEPAANPLVEGGDITSVDCGSAAIVSECTLMSGGTRARARRWTLADLPWLSSVRVSWGQRLQLLNISRSGLLVESGLRLSPGSRTTFQIGGAEAEFAVPARVLRSRVSDVNSLGVTYETAAVFDQPIDALAEREPDGIDAAARLAALVTIVRERASDGAPCTQLREAFEAGVLALITARDVRLRDAPVVENDGRESVYFSIPTGDRSPAVLQVTFNSNDQPCAEDFAVMLAAADAAAEVLPLTDLTRRAVVRAPTPTAVTAPRRRERELQIA